MEPIFGRVGMDSGTQVLWQDDQRVFCRGRRPGACGEQVLVAWPAVDPSLPASIDRLVHELSLKEELDGAWAVRPLELIREGGHTLLLLEDTGGAPLELLLGAPMDIGLCLRFAADITAALGKLHQRGIVHKDLKPANILVNCADGRVRLAGFGIASRVPRERQVPEPPEMIAGTLAYMAPEQTGRMNRSVDARSDLYALGVTLYRMLTGSLPFTASDPLEWVHCHIARKPVPPSVRRPTLPALVSALVMKLLAKTAEERYQTANGVERDLRRFLADWDARGRVDDFALGEYDVPDQMLIPEKLYGREREVETLLGAFDRIMESGRPELVLVSGHSGIGKSSVVKELQKVFLPPHGLFAAGKFDQLRRDIPYATLAQALQNLVRALVSKSDAELAPWRRAFDEALGANGQLMIDLVPELTLIVGNQAPVPELAPQDAQRRFQMVLRRFIGVFARPEHPLALFLDDLQWLDAATLDLLEHLLTRSAPCHLVLMGAYRDNEVPASHPLARKINAIVSAGGKVSEIKLAPLTREHLGQLLADAVRCDLERAAPLARLVHGRTGGNPLFATQFIVSLADEGMLAPDHVSAHWQWDLGRIHAKGYSDNIVDLMISKLGRLPAETRKALQQLACLGNSATIVTLSIVLGRSDKHVHAALWPAVRQELIERHTRGYRFVHDRVQEAAYSLIPKDLCSKAHLRIGRLLAAHFPSGKREEVIFDIVNQLGRGVASITSPGEREQLAELNLLAGKRARASAAFSSALAYFAAGVALLPEDVWRRRPELAFGLELNRAECEFLTGTLAEAELHLGELARRAAAIPDLASVARLQVELYTTLGQSDRAVEVCLDYLRHVGIEWSGHPTNEEVRQEYERIWEQIGNRAIEDLVDLPAMTDPRWRATMEVLIAAASPAQWTDKNLRFLVIGRMVNLSLEQGDSDALCLAFSWLGAVLGPAFGDYQAAYRFGKLGLNLVEQRDLHRLKARVYLVLACHIIPWTRPISTGRRLARRAFDSASELGDLTFASYSCDILISNLLASGNSLADVEREAETGLQFVRQARFSLATDMIMPQRQLVRTLRGLTPTFGCFDDAEFDEDQFERHLEADPRLAVAACWYWIRKLQARFFADQHLAALAAADQAQRLLWTSPSFFELAEYHFYAAAVRAALYDASADADRTRHREALIEHHGQLQQWAENCPENFASRTALLGAEIARLDGRELDAERLYERAIQAARADGLVHIEALADELTSRFYAARGFETIAGAYLRNARHGYACWGAEGKVRLLDQLHPQIKEAPRVAALSDTIGTPVEQLDLSTVIKVSQAVSGEIVLEKLVDTLMRTAMAQAGAGRALLILAEGTGERIAAEATTDGDTVKVRLCDEVVTAAALPESVLHYVLRSRECVILDDALAETPFAADPYIRQHRARSILGLPLLTHGKLIGMLYLENNLAPRVFVSTHQAVLKLLVSQAAIALENSRLYRGLAEREAKIRRLVDANIVGIFIYDLEGGVDEANDAFLRIVGYDREDLVSGRINWKDLTPPEWLDRDLRQWMPDLKRTGILPPFEKEFFKKDGSRVPVMLGTATFDEAENEGVAFVVDLTERKEAEQRLRESYEMLRELASHRETAREEERKHIAREMHDELGQHLTALRMRASALRMQLGNDRPQLVEQTQALITLVDETMRVVRGVISSLRPAALDTGIAAGLEWLAAEFNGNGRTVCHLRLQDENIAVSEDRSIVLFRLVQEALTNVARHAEASWVTITLERTPDACLLEVCDDGQGFDTLVKRNKSFGLAGMEERVLMLGGQIDVVSSPGTGTTINVSLPDCPAIPT